MIGVLCPEADLPVAAELFELFKTPWAAFEPERSFDVLLTQADAPESGARLVVEFGVAGAPATGETLIAEGGSLPIYGPLRTVDHGAPVARTERGETVVGRAVENGASTIRCGYSLLGEVRRLLDEGQPPERSGIPTLDLHIDLLRRWILAADVSFVEVPPRPARGNFVVSLTHDIDFLKLRDHRFDHTLAGFLSRATVGSMRDAIRGRRPWRDVRRNVTTAAATPLIHLGVVPDPWRPFESYLEADAPYRSTFFVVPFAGVKGRHVELPNADRRAVRYRIEEARPSIEEATSRGFEIGLHGIDAWVDPDSARIERERIAEVSGSEPEGVRMHWLCRDRETPRRLEAAGFGYDATVGYNEAVGFKAGTLQPYRPIGCSHLLELPLHIQDTSLLYSGRMSLGPEDAWTLGERLIRHASSLGGVLTLSWHDRSLAPERLWGSLYARFVTTLAEMGAEFHPARESVSLFRARRAARLEPDAAGKRVHVSADQAAPGGLLLRLNRPGGITTEVPLDRARTVELPTLEPAVPRS